MRELFYQNYKSNLILIHATLMWSFWDPGRLQLRVRFRGFVDVTLCQLDNYYLKRGGRHLCQTSTFHDHKVPSSEYFQTPRCDCRLPTHPLPPDI